MKEVFEDLENFVISSMRRISMKNQVVLLCFGIAFLVHTLSGPVA